MDQPAGINAPTVAGTSPLPTSVPSPVAARGAPPGAPPGSPPPPGAYFPPPAGGPSPYQAPPPPVGGPNPYPAPPGYYQPPPHSTYEIEETNEDGPKPWKWLVLGLVLWLFFGLFAFILLCFVKQLQKAGRIRNFFFIGCLIGLAFQIILVVISVALCANGRCTSYYYYGYNYSRHVLYSTLWKDGYFKLV